jgi:xanthine dehydrogenase accessory factor
MTDWIGTLRDLAARDESSVLVTVGKIRGSAPRETGARMIVTRQYTIGSIGGGQLEYGCAELACRLLAAGDEYPSVSRRTFPLGPELGQCCGGVVDVVFERLPGSKAEWLDCAYRCHDARTPAAVVTRSGASPATTVVTGKEGGQHIPADMLALVDEVLAGRPATAAADGTLVVPLMPGTIDVAVFGAGHVGAAVIEILAKLDCNVRWIDSRRRIFPEALPANVTALASEDPPREVAALPPGAFCLVMTHSHPLDLDICRQMLARDDLAYAGLIGSASKRRRFEKRLSSMGLERHRLGRLVCPVGVEGIDGKKPVEIALSVVAQVLQVRDSEQRIATAAGSLEALG